jgi:hypothetical protein
MESFFERLVDEGLLAQKGSNIKLTHQGRLVCDAIGTAVLECADLIKQV